MSTRNVVALGIGALTLVLLGTLIFRDAPEFRIAAVSAVVIAGALIALGKARPPGGGR